MPTQPQFSSWLERVWRRSATYSRAAAYLSSLAVGSTFFYHLATHSTAYLGLLEDDHFYYSVVADNLFRLGRLTYDGITATNGFHPLWFCVLLALRGLTGGLGTAFYLALTCISLAAMIINFELSRSYARVLGASAPLAACIAALYSVATARVLATGMECVIAVPLFIWWLRELARPAELTPRRSALLGWLASLAILARLDIAIAVAIALAANLALVRTPWRERWRQLAAFSVGGALVPLYAAWNLIYFHTPFPVSALAKRLMIAQGFDIHYAFGAAFRTQFGPSTGIVLALGGIAAWQLHRRRALAGPALFSAGVVLIFTAVFFFINSLSGWIFFGWYAYPFPAALLAAMVLISKRWPPIPALRSGAIFTLFALILVAPLSGAVYYAEHGPGWSVGDNALLAMSYQLAERTKARPGLYAMGAVAGMARVTMGRPLIQIEGIISDKEMVEHIRNQDDLGQVLRRYHADFLIATYAGKHPSSEGECVLVTQPEEQWAGKRTAKMAGWICGAPAEHFFTEPGTHSYSQFPRMETFVWDLTRVDWKPYTPRW